MIKAWGPVWLWCVGIFLLSHQVSFFSLFPRRLFFLHMDKFFHFGVYAVLALLSARAVGRRSPGLSPGARMLAAVLVASAYGLTDECHQAFVPGRSPELLDFLADTLGGLVGAAAFVRSDGSRDDHRRASPLPLVP